MTRCSQLLQLTGLGLPGGVHRASPLFQTPGEPMLPQGSCNSIMVQKHASDVLKIVRRDGSGGLAEGSRYSRTRLYTLRRSDLQSPINLDHLFGGITQKRVWGLCLPPEGGLQGVRCSAQHTQPNFISMALWLELCSGSYATFVDHNIEPAPLARCTHGIAFKIRPLPS